MKGKNKEDPADLEPADWRNILTALTTSVTAVQEMLKEKEEKQEDCPKFVELEKRTRILEDAQDHHHQRSLKGKFLISFAKTKEPKTEKELQQQGQSLPAYVVELVLEKLGARIKETEIKSCHYTNTGIIFWLWDLKPGSGFSQVVSGIKGGQGRDVQDIYVNFALTPRRASMLFEIRQLKRAGKIHKFYADHDGSLTVVKEEKGKKQRVTSFVVRAVGGTAGGEGGAAGAAARFQGSGHLRTLTVQEIKDRFQV
jgi:hypothetical protein